jgi:DNA polymerase-3 subunit alpha
MGIEVLPPHVNESFEEFAVIRDASLPSGGRIRFGLGAIKNLGHLAAREIVEERKRGGQYQTLEDFLERVESKDLNKKSLESLIKVGALEGLGEQGQLIENLEALVKFSRQAKSLASEHENSLFGAMPLPKARLTLAGADPVEEKARLLWEKELLGLYVSGHPVAPFQEYLGRAALPLGEVERQPDGARVRVGGIIAAVRKVITKNGGSMYFLGLEDMTGRAEILVFGKTAESVGESLREDAVVLASVRVSHKEGQIRLILESLERLSEEKVSEFARAEQTRRAAEKRRSDAAPHSPEPILVRLGEAGSRAIEHLSRVLAELPEGGARVKVSVNGTVIETAFALERSQATLDALSGVPGVVHIE